MTLSLRKPSAGAEGWGAGINRNFTEIEDEVNAVIVPMRVFGDGSGGDVTIDSDTTLSDDVICRTLTVTDSARLTTAGLRVYASESVTVDSGAAISNNGEDGSPGAGGAGASGFNFGYAGWGQIGFQGDDTFDSWGGDGGDASQSGGTANRPDSSFSPPRTYASGIIGYLLASGVNGNNFNAQIGTGAGGGGGTGGGGGGGGGLLVATPSLVVNGSIEARGGNGNGTGVGGGGGVVILLYASKTGAGTISAAAGSGGSNATAGTIFELTPS